MLENLALEKTVTNMLNANFVTDGDTKNYNRQTGYASCNWPEEVVLDLEDVYELQKISLYLWDLDKRYYHYIISLSSDNQNWTVVKNMQRTPARGYQFVNLDSQKARYIKIDCLYNSNNRGFHIVQLEVFGESKRESTFPIPLGYENVGPILECFKKDHPNYDQNVFIMMRFRQDSPFPEIHSAIVSALKQRGYNGLRADHRTYPQDDDLWMNVCTYMLGCKYGVAVFERGAETQEYSPNVELEYGFMRAMNKRVLLLKYKDRTPLNTDVVGKIYKEFDSSKIVPSIEKQISKWIRDIE